MGLQNNKKGLTRSEFTGLLTNAVNDAVDKQLAPFKAKQTNWFEQLTSGNAAEGGAPAIINKRKQRSLFGRACRSLAVAKGDPDNAVSYARKTWGSDSRVHKGLLAGDATSGGFLIADDLSDELILELRAFSAVRAMEPMFVRLPRGQLEFPRISTSAQSSWLGEAQDVPESTPQFDRVVLTAKKNAALVAASNEMLNFPDSAIEDVIASNMARTLGTNEDIAFLRGDGLINQPLGLTNLAGNSLAAGAFTLAQTTSDLYAMLEFLQGADVGMQRPGWVFNFQTPNALASMRDANGNFGWQSLHENPQMLLNMPFVTSNNLPNTTAILADFADVVVGEASSIEIQISGDGTYTSGGSLVSAFARDETLIRAILRVDINVKHPESVATLTNLAAWTA
jgi:HK97 family phage major capsid protein